MEFKGLSSLSAVFYCLGLSVLFVLSLYIVDPGLSRNHPKTVLRRLLATLCVCFIAPFYLWAFSDEPNEDDSQSLLSLLGIKWNGLLYAVLCPVVLVLVLYAGPIVHTLLDGDSFIEHITSERTDINIRNYLLAPLAEELVFRACMLPVLIPQFGVFWSVIVCPLFFGLAHVHHLIEWARRGSGIPFSTALTAVAVQVCYTSIFGMFSAFLLVRSGHVISPIVSHSLCNMLGLPPFEGLPSHPHRTLLAATYVLGLAAFCLLLTPLTQSSLFL